MIALVAALASASSAAEEPPDEPAPPRRWAERICRRCSTTWRTDPVAPESCWSCGLPGGARAWPDLAFPQMVHGYQPLYPANETEL